MQTGEDPFYIAPADPPSKRELLRAALALFVRNGLAETSIRDLAKESGYTNPVLFKHFSGKEDLAVHLFRACYLHLAAQFGAAVNPESSFAENLRALLAAYATILDENLEAYLFVQDHLRRFWPQMPNSVRSESLVARTKAMVVRGIEQGAIARDVDPDLLVAAIGGILAQVARMRYFGSFQAPARFQVPQLETMILRMVRQE